MEMQDRSTNSTLNYPLQHRCPFLSESLSSSTHTCAHTHTHFQTLVLLQMSHPPQADNYSVSDGVRWRVGCGTDLGRGGARGESGAAQWFITTVLNAHPSSAACPLQPPASSLAACLRVTRWHRLFFHVLQLHATPIKPRAAPLLHNNTPAADWQEERRTRTANGHKSSAGWQLPPNVDCFLVIFKAPCFIVCVCGNICLARGESVMEMQMENSVIYKAMQHLLPIVIVLWIKSMYSIVPLLLLWIRSPNTFNQNKWVAFIMPIVSEIVMYNYEQTVLPIWPVITSAPS